MSDVPKVHTIYTCQRCAQLPVEGRLETVKRKGLSHNCLASRHRVKNCNSTINDRHCNSRHHSLLHKSSAAGATSPSPLASLAPPALTSSTGFEQIVSSRFSMNTAAFRGYSCHCFNLCCKRLSKSCCSRLAGSRVFVLRL